jgi:hypothetical protein
LKPTLGGFTGMAVLDDDPRPMGSELIPEEQEEQEIVH